MNKVTILIMILLFILSINGIMAVQVSQSHARLAADKQLTRIKANIDSRISSCLEIVQNGVILGYVFHLSPIGYIIVAGDDGISPVIAYSTQADYADGIDGQNILAEIVTADLSNRSQFAKSGESELINQNRNQWQTLINSNSRPVMQQWPPEGYSATGGWIKTRWTQSAPYNALCPMDNVTHQRSVAGCPAIAMGQIVNYHGTINGTSFSDADEYHHNYGGNSYWIDNDSTAFGFPSFTTLNSYLNTAMHHYRYQENITNTDKAAVVFGCAIAATQVFGSAGSGTFSVNQAFAAYQRFNFTGMELLTPADTDVNERITQNMMDASPVHYAIVTPANDAGHNVVIDGYNTDGFFHVNFGWGGQYDGWYLLPSGLPYNLTVLEGAIVDINPYKFAAVLPESVDIMTAEDAAMPHELILMNNSLLGDITIEAYDFNENFAGVNWVVSGLNLPVTLAYGETINFTLQANYTVLHRDTTETEFRIIHNNGVVIVPIRWNNGIVVNQDETIPLVSDIILKQNYPNPFSKATTLNFELSKNSDVTLSIYNLKGEKVCNLMAGRKDKGTHTLSWDGKDAKGLICPNGFYMYKLSDATTSKSRMMLLIR